MNYSLYKITQIVNGQFFGNRNQQISELVTDSRSVRHKLNETIFVAIVGSKNNGHSFINELIDKKYNNFMVSKMPEKINNENYILVSDTLRALQLLVAFHRSQFKYPVVGITGSNGKTIVKEWLYQLLSNKYQIIRSPKSYNSQIGVPLSVWKMNETYNFAIFEAGISKADEMKYLEKIIKPNIGVFTNIGDAHQENFVDLKNKIKEKLSLFIDSEVIVYGLKNKMLAEIIQERYPNKKHITWGTNSEACLQITEIIQNKQDTEIKGIIRGEAKSIKIKAFDVASCENSCLLWVLLDYFNINQAEIERQMQQLHAVAMRLEMLEGTNNCSIINDGYNSDLSSLQVALDVMARQHQHAKQTLILSDLLQNNPNENLLYSELANLIKTYPINRLIGIGPALLRNSNLLEKELIKICSFYPDTDSFLKQLQKDDFKNEAILVKGSRDFKFERITAVLQKKTHRTVLKINMLALAHNLNYFRSFLNPTTKVMVMVKAFSYGSGSHEIASFLQEKGVDYLGVAVADEGVELRKAGISLPIIVMNPEVQSFRNMIEHELEPELFTLQGIELFSKTLDSFGLDSYPIHLKLDTGMHRLGFENFEINSLLIHLDKFNNLKVKTIFSHLATSDENGKDDFTFLQIKRFNILSEKIIKHLPYPISRHLLNSAGIERFSAAQFEMVRLGIGLYGISATEQLHVKNISSLETKILQIRNVPQNETVGYGRNGILTRDSKIAVLPIGYADGLNRGLSKGVGRVWLKDGFAPIVGNICMDMCMIDVTELDAKVGDTVEVFGANNTITHLANQLNTIPYEILTGISQRVKRIYIEEYL